MHGAIAVSLGIEATTATLQEPEHRLTDDRLTDAYVLLWWGHAAHFAKIFKRLMGTRCKLTWREAGERERLWVMSRNYTIAAGLPDHFELENEVMYGAPFGVPMLLETVFYFCPGHEIYPTYHDANVQRVLSNAVRWALNPEPRLKEANDAKCNG